MTGLSVSEDAGASRHDPQLKALFTFDHSPERGIPIRDETEYDTG